MRVTCPAHRKALGTYLQQMKDNAHRMIDPVHGRVQNNLLESGFSHVWDAGVKRMCMGAIHFYLCACIGLLNSNQTAMRTIKGPDYSWRYVHPSHSFSYCIRMQDLVSETVFITFIYCIYS